MAVRWLDEREAAESKKRLGRRLVQTLARFVLQVWQKRRLESLRAEVRAGGDRWPLTELASRLGWDQTRAYEAERDHGQCIGDPDPASMRLWPRLRSLDELLVIELALIEVGVDEPRATPALGALFGVLTDHFSLVSPSLVRRELELSLGPLDEQLWFGLTAWLCDQRKSGDVRSAGEARVLALVPGAIAAFHALALRHYDEILAERAHPLALTGTTDSGTP